MIYFDLILNLALLVALSIVSGFIEKRWPRHTRPGVLLQGILFGATAVFGMLRPLNLGAGLIFDGRSVMVSLCALFFGPWAAAMAGAMTIICRLVLGGAGMIMGVLVIFSSTGIGLLARCRLQPDAHPPSARSLYLFGLAVHMAMIALMFTLPGGAGPAVIKRIGLPVMLLYPLATILAGKILSDQIETVRLMEALKEREERYARLFNNSNDAIFVHGMGAGKDIGLFTEVNDIACLQLGYSRQELLRMSPADIDAAGMDASRRCVLEALAKTGHAVFEMVHVSKSGNRIPVEMSSRVFGNKGERCVLSIARDITDRKRAREELLRINESLEQRVAQEVSKNIKHEFLLIQQSRLAAMGEMIGNIAHQWRQPLNALGLLLFNIRDAFRFNTLDAAYLDQAVADGSRMVQKMSATISDFSNFFRPDKEISTFSALEQIREAAALVESSFQYSNISIQIDAPQDFKLLGFPNEYSQVLLNLLSNAKDAILARSQPQSSGSGRVEIVLSKRNGQGIVTVADSGAGIPAEILERIFDPYFSTKGSGTGIGLYMSKMIIERNMNGSITAKNIAGGAEFIVASPLAAGNEGYEKG